MFTYTRRPGDMDEEVQNSKILMKTKVMKPNCEIPKTNSQKKAETYDSWKEKKLIQELNHRRQELSDQNIKEKLSHHITNGRRELNELAVKNWLKKKEQEKKGRDKKCEPLRGTESLIINKRRNTISYSRPMVVNNLNDVIKSNFEQLNVRVDYNENNETLTTLYDINTNSSNKDRGAGDYDKNDFSQVYKVKCEPQQQSTEQESVENRYKAEPIDTSDQQYKNKNERTLDEYYKLLGDYYYNCESMQDTNFDSTFDRSLTFDREYSNKISFNEWLKRKNKLLREKKECELRAEMIKEEEKMHKKLMSKKALEDWYVRNACLTFRQQMPIM